MREKEERDALGKGGKVRANSEKRREYLQLIDRVTTSFFFTNIPDDASSEILWKLFLKFGRVMEVYIPRKFDKRGRQFGFVKFKEVEDVELLSDKLQEVWLGSFKLLVYRSRFARSESKEASNGVQNEANKRTTLQLKDVEAGRSFKTTLIGGGSQQKTMMMKVPVNEELCKELQGSVVGTLAREKDVRRIQTTLYMEGFRSIMVTNMGGNMVLMRSPVEGDVARLMRSKNECLQYYFSEIKPWNPGLLAVQREVWIQIYGIPIHIWGENFFKMVGKSLGTFLDFDEETARMARFDVARLKILTSTMSFIDVAIKVEVEGACFDLWVVEERGRNRSVVVRGDDIEDVGSKVMPPEVGGVVEEDGFSDGTANSDEMKSPVMKLKGT
jgi:RNA recognition motif-containing protein